MTVKLYSCGMMKNHREREMMKALVSDLIQRFSDFDDCIILVEPEFKDEEFGISLKPDCIIFKDNIFIILELKSWLGEIEIDIENHVWKAIGNCELQYYIDKLYEKPDSQVIRYSEGLKELLLNKFYKEFRPEKYPKLSLIKSEKPVQWAIVLRDYVILKPGSTIRVKSKSFDPRPRIISADKVLDELSLLRKEQKWLPDTVINSLITIFHGRETDIDHLFSKPNQWEAAETMATVREYVSNLLSDTDPKKIQTGLELSGSMKLKSLYNQILEIYFEKKETAIRIAALKSLISIDQSELKYLFSVGLRGEDEKLTEFILDLMIKYPYFSDINSSLEDLLNSKDLNIVNKSIKALSRNRTIQTCEFFENLLKELLYSKPYLLVNELSYLESEAKRLRDSYRQLYREKFNLHVQVHKNKNIYVYSCTFCKQDKIHEELVLKHIKIVGIIEASGNCNCRAVIKLITAVIEQPETVGIPPIKGLFEANDYNIRIYQHFKPSFSGILTEEPGDHKNYYFDILKSGLNAIATMAYHGAIGTFEKVLQIPDDDVKQYAIAALGILGGENEVNLLKSLLNEEEDDRLNRLAIIALTETGDPSVLDIITRIYFASVQKILEQKTENVEENPYLNEIERIYKASKKYLLKVDPGGFEHVLLNRIKDEKSEDNKLLLLNDLLHFSTADSVDLAWSLLNNEKLHEISEGILFRLSDTEAVITRAKELITSKNEDDREFAYRLLNVYFRNHIEELDAIQIQSDSDLKSKLDLYSYMGLWQRLLNYLSSSKKDIREHALEDLNYIPGPMKLKEYYEWVMACNESSEAIEIEVFTLGEKLILKKSSKIEVYDFDSTEMSTLQMEGGKVALRLNPKGVDGSVYMRLQNEDVYGQNNFHSIISLLEESGNERHIELYKTTSNLSRNNPNIADPTECNLDYVQWLKLWR